MALPLLLARLWLMRVRRGLMRLGVLELTCLLISLTRTRTRLPALLPLLLLNMVPIQCHGIARHLRAAKPLYRARNADRIGSGDRRPG